MVTDLFVWYRIRWHIEPWQERAVHLYATLRSAASLAILHTELRRHTAPPTCSNTTEDIVDQNLNRACTAKFCTPHIPGWTMVLWWTATNSSEMSLKAELVAQHIGCAQKWVKEYYTPSVHECLQTIIISVTMITKSDDWTTTTTTLQQSWSLNLESIAQLHPEHPECPWVLSTYTQ